MKVLFDCILTHHPESCSTNAQFLTLAEELLMHPGVFIYWPVPTMVTDEHMAVYPKDARIKYVRTHQSKDRMREYNRVMPDLADLLSFEGSAWDWDVLVTVRTPQVPTMRVISTTPRRCGRRDWSKRIIVIEDMMVLSKKPTVFQSNEAVQDRMTLEGYFAADQVLMPAYHHKGWVRTVAKEHFSMSRVRELEMKIREVSHLSLPDMHLKGDYRWSGDIAQRRMNVAFVGRLERTNARLTSINKMLANQFILHGDKVYPFICTVSETGSPGEGHLDLDAIEILHPKRLEFHRIAREEMDLAVFFHIDSELNMSILEPMCFGVPIIVKKAAWSIGMLGEKYPYFVDTDTQGYALINKFADNYGSMYKVFSEWYTSVFVPLYTKRREEDDLYKHLLQEILRPVEDMQGKLGASAEDNEIVQLIAEHGGQEFVLLDLIKALGKTHLRTLAGKVGLAPESSPLTWLIGWNDFRLALMAFHGYTDASVQVGHMKKVA